VTPRHTPPHQSTASAAAGTRRWAAPAVLATGALAYAGVVGGLDWTFNLTPLAVGVIALAAAAAGRRPRLVPIGLVLLGWGAAVLLVRNGPVPDNREAAAYLVGAALGLVAAERAARRAGLATTGAIITLLNGGLAFALAYDVPALGDWPVWAVALAAWAVIEALRPSASGLTSAMPSSPSPLQQ